MADSLSATCHMGPMIRRFRHRIAPIALLLVIASSCWAGGQKSPLNEFVETYRCRVVQHLRAIHEHGTRSYSHNRYLILEMTHSPQRFVQCIFYEYDSKLLCEASSGRYKLPPGQQYAIELSREGTAALARLGYAPPFQVANYSQDSPGTKSKKFQFIPAGSSSEPMAR